MKKILYILFFVCSFCQGQTIIDSYKYAPAEIDVFPQNNAASLADLNSIGTFTTSAATIAVDATDFTDGVYSIKGTATGGFGNLNIIFPVVSGNTYNFSVWAKRGASGTTQQIWLISPNIVASNVLVANVTTTTWTEYTFSRVAVGTGNATIRFYPSFSGASGNEILIDKITIIETP